MYVIIFPHDMLIPLDLFIRYSRKHRYYKRTLSFIPNPNVNSIAP